MRPPRPRAGRRGCPTSPNVLFLAGQKFGSSGRPDLTWALNVVVPAIVAPHFRGSRIVVFSTGNVYPLVDPGLRRLDRERTRPARSASTRSPASAASGSSSTTRASAARGASSSGSSTRSTCATARSWTWRGRSTPASRWTCAWATSTRSGRATRTPTPSARSRCASTPPRPLVVTGPEVVSGARRRRASAGASAGSRASPASPGPALLGDAALCVSLLGPPEVPLARLLDWVAAWVRQGGRSLGKPTHFEATDGRF